MSIVQKFFGSLFKPSYIRTQAIIDEIHVAYYLRLHAKYVENPAFVETDATHDEMMKAALECTDIDRRKFITEILDKKVVDLFQNIHASIGGSNLENIDKNRSVSSVSSSLSSYYQPTILNEKLRNAVGFELELSSSSIPDAGRGVFLRTNKKGVLPGSLIALYPGQVYMKEFVKTKQDIEALGSDDDYLMMFRTDGICIDGRKLDKVPYNPYAQAHLVNHVPVGQEPNIIPILYNFTASTSTTSGFPSELCQYIPNIYARQPTLVGSPDERTTIMQTILFLSSCAILKDEELILDYRISPHSKGDLPSWYKHYNAEAALRRWATEEQLKHPYFYNYAKERVVLRSKPKPKVSSAPPQLEQPQPQLVLQPALQSQLQSIPMPKKEEVPLSSSSKE